MPWNIKKKFKQQKYLSKIAAATSNLILIRYQQYLTNMNSWRDCYKAIKVWHNIAYEYSMEQNVVLDKWLTHLSHIRIRDIFTLTSECLIRSSTLHSLQSMSFVWEMRDESVEWFSAYVKSLSVESGRRFHKTSSQSSNNSLEMSSYKGKLPALTIPETFRFSINLSVKLILT